MATKVVKYFDTRHLPLRLQTVANPICELAKMMESTLPDGPEKSAGMRKLLEAKDCFIRSAMEVGQ